MILRTGMFYECNTEAERSLLWDSTFLIFTKENGGKWWKIYNNEFIEVLKENLQSSIGKNGSIYFNWETSKDVSFGMTFLRSPKISLELDAESINPPYKINTTLTGFTIKFKTKYRGNVEWTTIK